MKNIITFMADELSGSISDPLGGRFTSLANVIGFIFNLLIGVAWFLAFYNIVLGFVGITVSAGDADAAKKGQQKVMYGIVGAVILFFITILKDQILTLLGAGGFSVNTVTNF